MLTQWQTRNKIVLKITKKIKEKLRVWKKKEKNGFMRKKIFEEIGFVNVTRKKMHNVKKIVWRDECNQATTFK